MDKSLPNIIGPQPYSPAEASQKPTLGIRTSTQAQRPPRPRIAAFCRSFIRAVRVRRSIDYEYR